MNHPSDTARVFFALWPAATESAQLAAWQPALRELCGGRAMRGETLHNTLVFIGEVGGMTRCAQASGAGMPPPRLLPQSAGCASNVSEAKLYRLEVLQLAAQEVSGEGFELRFDEARYWGHNHIVYAAPRQVPQQLAQLADALEQRLAAHRFKFASHHLVSHEYKPHVTLLRNAHWSDAPLPAMQPVSWQIRDFALVQSAPRDGLMDYRVLARFPLGGG
jgi:2'-5' RNA ligase